MTFKREYSRASDSVRPIILEFDCFGFADASVLLQLGETKVLVSVSLEDGVPRFLRGKKVGWLTAEYSMLPCATQKRTNRESSQQNRNSRSVEISRLIGRCLRSVTDLSFIGEKTITIDCDVLQADGGTRVSCITAASIALNMASKRWMNSGIVDKSVLKEEIAAVSAGVVGKNLLLDLSYVEDSKADADFNFVLTKSGKLVEVQGTSEKEPLSWEYFETLRELALNGVAEIFKACEGFSKNIDEKLNVKKLKQVVSKKGNQNFNQIKKAPFFSLGNRLDKAL